MKTPTIFAKGDDKPVTANTLQVLRTMLFAFMTTMNTCCQILALYALGRCSRDKADRILKLWARRLLKQARLHIEVNYLQHLDYEENQAYMLMSNHSSLYDIPIILATLPGSIRMLAKKELSRLPILAGTMLASEFVFVDRKNRQASIKDLARCKEKMQDGIRLWVAPEGARSKSGDLQTFKKGVFITAIETGAKIIPIGIVGAHAALPSKTLKLQLNSRVKVNIGHAINTAGYDLSNKDALITQVHDTIEQLIHLA